MLDWQNPMLDWQLVNKRFIYGYYEYSILQNNNKLLLSYNYSTLYNTKSCTHSQSLLNCHKNSPHSPHSYKMYFKMLSSSSKLLASHIERPRMYSGSFLRRFSLAAGSWPYVLPAPVASFLLISCKALRRCSTFLSAVWSSSVRASFFPDL